MFSRCVPAHRLLRAAGSLLLSGLLLSVASSLHAQTLKVCIGNGDNPPLSFPDHDGQAQYLIRHATLEQGWQVEFYPVPWRRCRAGVASGHYDAAGTATATPSNQQIMAFPRQAGVPDTTQILGEFHLVVVRPVGSVVDWDGNRFSGLDSPVLYNAGFVAAGDRLKQLGVAGDDRTKLLHQMMQMLLLGRGQVGIGQAPIVELNLQKPEFAGRLEVLPTPFVRTGLYLGFNKDFYARHGLLVDALWQAIGRMRTAPEWQELAPRLAQ